MRLSERYTPSRGSSRVPQNMTGTGSIQSMERAERPVNRCESCVSSNQVAPQPLHILKHSRWRPPRRITVGLRITSGTRPSNEMQPPHSRTAPTQPNPILCQQLHIQQFSSLDPSRMAQHRRVPPTTEKSRNVAYVLFSVSTPNCA